ncbi:MAG: TAXI family TRAP transporter solute-binding subunit [Pseudomonadota bacterium]
MSQRVNRRLRTSVAVGLATTLGLAACQAVDEPRTVAANGAEVCGTPVEPPEQTYFVGTGEVYQPSYQIGGAVQRFVNEGRDDHGIRLSVQSTEGPVVNETAILSGELAFGFVPAVGPTSENPEIRSLFTVRRIPYADETLITSEEVPDYVVCEVVRSVFEDLDSFRRFHPVLVSLDAENMVEDVFAAPLHPGALRYFDAVSLPVPERLRT